MYWARQAESTRNNTLLPVKGAAVLRGVEGRVHIDEIDALVLSILPQVVEIAAVVQRAQVPLRRANLVCRLKPMPGGFQVPQERIEDDGQATYHREIDAVSDEGGQQLFEAGSSLPRLGRALHANAF